MRRHLLPLLVALLVVVGCTGPEGSPEAGPDEGRSVAPEATASSAEPCTGGTRTMTLDGTTWSYDVQVPPGTDEADRLPVVFLLHGLGGGAAQVAGYTGFDDAATRDDFVLVTPQANGFPSTWDLEGSADVEFLSALVTDLPGTPCIDPDRRFVAGFSNGSAMAFLLACEGDLPIRAFGAVAAAGYEAARCDDAPPASFVYVHGTADDVVPYGGGSTPLLPVESVETTMDQWARHDACPTGAERTSVADDVRRWRWAGCADGSRIDVYVVEGGGHTWPGAQAGLPFLGATTENLDATATMVHFFGLDA